MDYGKTLTSLPGMFTSLEEIQAYIEECEQKWLNLENIEIWSKAYVSATRSIETQVNYHVQVKLVASNEPLMGCGPVSDWLRNKHIYAIYTFDDNMCMTLLSNLQAKRYKKKHWICY